MKRFIPHMVVAAFAVAFSGAAWGQQSDLDVTMSVLPANASAGSAINEMKLPDASDRGAAASAFGQSVSSRARDMKGDLGRDFGQSVSEAARDKTHAPKGLAKGQNK